MINTDGAEFSKQRVVYVAGPPAPQQYEVQIPDGAVIGDWDKLPKSPFPFSISGETNSG